MGGGPGGHKLNTRGPCIFFYFYRVGGPEGRKLICDKMSQRQNDALTQNMVWRYVALTQYLAVRGYATLTAVREPSARGSWRAVSY